MKQLARPTLSPRQIEIASLVRHGKTSRQIGEALYIDRRTVETHIETICKKLGVRTRVEMVVALFGATEPPSPDDRPTESMFPVPLTSFVGRAAEIADVAQMLGNTHLLTLVGPGGIGKTRVALQVGGEVVDDFPDGVWLIELASLTSSEYLDATIAGALRVSTRSTNALESLISHLRSKCALLIIDNCEHLVTHVARVVSAVLRSCRQIRILTTTRERLRTTGESVYQVLPLPTPGAGVNMTAAAADAYAAVTLFVERSRAVNPRFALTDRNAMAIGEICRRLDGIPLAIELAAARTSVLGLDEILNRLPERLRILTNGNSDADSRHQTLRGAFDWSHDLLQPQERALFRRLAIFVDSWTLDAAERICADEKPSTPTILDLLSSLVEKSLVVFDADCDPPRYRLLVSTRIYAHEQLVGVGELEWLAQRHLAYYVELFERVQAMYQERVSEANVLSLNVDLGNARAALDWSISSNNAKHGATLFTATHFWYFAGLHDETISRAQSLLSALSDDAAHLRSQLRLKLMYARDGLGDTARAFEESRLAVEEARRTENSLLLARAVAGQAYLATRTGRYDLARASFREAEAALDRFESAGGTATAYTRAGLVEARSKLAVSLGDLGDAKASFARARSLHSQLGNRRMRIATTLDLAKVHHACGETEAAIALIREELNEAQLLDHNDVYAHLLAALAACLASIGEGQAALQTAQSAISLLRSANMPIRLAEVIQSAALAFARIGDYERAAQLGGYSFEVISGADVTLEYAERKIREQLTLLLEDHLSPTEQSTLHARGLHLSPDQAVTLALGTSRSGQGVD